MLSIIYKHFTSVNWEIPSPASIQRQQLGFCPRSRCRVKGLYLMFLRTQWALRINNSDKHCELLAASSWGKNKSAPRIPVWISGRKPGGVTQVCNSTTQNVETRGSWVQGHPLLHSELEASLGSVKPYLRKQRKTSPPKMEPFQAHMHGHMPQRWNHSKHTCKAICPSLLPCHQLLQTFCSWKEWTETLSMQPKLDCFSRSTAAPGTCISISYSWGSQSHVKNGPCCITSPHW